MDKCPRCGLPPESDKECQYCGLEIASKQTAPKGASPKKPNSTILIFITVLVCFYLLIFALPHLSKISYFKMPSIPVLKWFIIFGAIGLFINFLRQKNIGKGKGNRDSQKRKYNDRFPTSSKYNSDLIEIPRMPETVDKEYDAWGSSGKDQIYKINPYQMTCTCKDFEERRSGYAITDVRRACKHLVRFMTNTHLTSYDLLTKALLKQSRGAGGVPHILLKKKMFEKTEILLGMSPGWSGVKVFSRKKRTVDADDVFTGDVMFNEFDLKNKKWIYGPSPSGAREIRRIIGEVFK